MWEIYKVLEDKLKSSDSISVFIHIPKQVWIQAIKECLPPPLWNVIEIHLMYLLKMDSPYKNVSNSSLPSRSFFSQPYVSKCGPECKRSTFGSVLALSCNGLFLSWYNKSSIPRSVIEDNFIFWLLKSIPSWDIFIEFFVSFFVLPGKPNYIWEALRTINVVCRTRKIQFIHTLTHSSTGALKTPIWVKKIDATISFIYIIGKPANWYYL